MANSQHAEDNPQHVKMPGGVVVTSTPEQASSAAGIDPGAASAVPSFAAASELLSAPYSCLVLSTHRRHVALPPMYLHKKKTGIKEELNAELLKFSQSLNGVPLAYDNIRIVGHRGDIYDDSGYIHLNIEANFILFQPKKGQTLVGKVNKLGASHVGCLVHGCFNASIPKPNLVSMETWRDAGPNSGSELEFDVTALDADTAGVLLIRGRLSRTRVQELLAIGEATVSTELSTVDQPDEPVEAQTTEPEATETPPEETPKKKKKKKDKIKDEASFTPEKHTAPHTTLEFNVTMNETIDKTNGNTEKKKKNKKPQIKEEEREEPVTALFTPESKTVPDPTMDFNGTMDETNVNAGKKKKKKKKKKKEKEKYIKEEPEEVELSSMQVHGSDSSGYFSDKSINKRKLEIESSPYFSPEFEMPCKKKIKTLIELKTEYE